MLLNRFTFALAALLFNVTVLAQVNVVTSIRPLQLIASEITQGVSMPAVILENSQDPHHPALRPSQRQQMSEAEIFLWVGPGLETGFDRVAANLDAAVIKALELPLHLYHVGGQPDPHVWLSLANAGLIGEALALELTRQDPLNAALYSNNLDRFSNKLAEHEERINSLLDADTFPPYAVYHDAFQYFETQFGLSHETSFTANEELQPGIRKILQVKNIIEAANAKCIIVNPSVNTEFLQNQLGIKDLKFVEADQLGSGLGSEITYTDFMLGLASSFSNCRNNNQAAQ